MLILNDPEMVKQFLVKDFNYFVDRKFPLEKFLMKETIGDKLWLKGVLFAGGKSSAYSTHVCLLLNVVFLIFPFIIFNCTCR